MNTDAFQKFSTKYGLDSEIVASFCESFATHVDLSKENLSIIYIIQKSNEPSRASTCANIISAF